METLTLKTLLREKQEIETNIEKTGNDFFILYGLTWKLHDVEKKIARIREEDEIEDALDDVVVNSLAKL